ncbi:MAG: VWA domain-containing protein [Proteobacteria bacterium]|nr:VWA domain-containing protein [Pseudomonadota bacterium]
MRPEWLWALLPAAILALLLLYFRGKGGSWSEVIAPELLPYLVGNQQATRGPNLVPLLFIAWAIAAVAAAGPAWEKLPQPIHQKQDALVLALDLSYSMMAQDLSPSRLIRARQKLLDLLEQRGEGQTGLIAYAGDSHIVTPLTDDNPTIANLIPALNPGMMPVPGSDPVAAIRQSIELLRSAGIIDGKIMLITDGVDDEAATEIKSLLRGKGISFAVLGIGTRTGAPIPLPQGGFIKDSSGNIVIPTLDESSLRALAAKSGGTYSRISLDDDDLDRLLSETLPNAGGQTLALERTADAWEDRGYLLILLLLPVALSLFRRGWVVCLLPLLFLGNPQQASAQSWDDLWLTPDQQGQKALNVGDNEAAASLFENPDWAATAAYRNEDYERAAKQFAENKTADSAYNHGNALAKAGELDEAIAAYKKSLELQAEQSDAIENIELLEKMKEQQEQQQEQQDQEKSDEDQNQDEEQEQDQQDQSGDQEQSDEQSDKSDPPQDPPQEPEENEQDQDEESGQEPEEEEQSSENEQQQAEQAEEPSEEDKEKEQAMEQWLRRVPDDPSGLLREKFRYESRQREQRGDRRENETYW